MSPTPRNRNDAQNFLDEVWGNSPETAFGHLVIDFLSSHTDSVHIPFAQFLEIARANKIQNNDVVLNIVNYLTGANLHLLRTSFEYIDGETVEPLDVLQVKAAQQFRVNPITGDVDEAVGDKIFVYFVPTDLAKEVLPQ
jgi:hypothetical protein